MIPMYKPASKNHACCSSLILLLTLSACGQGSNDKNQEVSETSQDQILSIPATDESVDADSAQNESSALLDDRPSLPSEQIADSIQLSQTANAATTSQDEETTEALEEPASEIAQTANEVDLMEAEHTAPSTSDTKAEAEAAGPSPGEQVTDAQQDVATVKNYATPDNVEQCSVEDIKRRVDFDMRDYYIHYDQVPVLELDDFDTAEALIEALRVEPDIYSNVQNAVTHTTLTAGGTRSDYGFWFYPSADNTVRFRESRLGSPSDIAGILRGDELIEFNGSPIAQVSNQQVQDAFDNQGSAITMTIRTGSNAPREVSVPYKTYQWQTAGRVKRFPASAELDRPSIGYIQVRQFIATTHNEIVSGLEELRNAGGVDELIVDLRYNPGGITWIARHMASTIGGEAVAGQIFARYTTNEKYSDEVELFDTVADPLNLPRVVVLATDRSASASEAFINSLKPFIDVVVIGDITNGKPYSSFILPYCDKTINAMNMLRTNSAGVSVLGGIQPDCYIEDDWKLASNNANDPLTAEAIHYISNGACSTPVQRTLSSRIRITESTLTSEPHSLITFPTRSR